jgi:hypothetical protein
MPEPVKMPKNPKSFVAGWLKEIDDALKREKKYRRLGKWSVDLYEAKDPEECTFQYSVFEYRDFNPGGL